MTKQRLGTSRMQVKDKEIGGEMGEDFHRCRQLDNRSDRRRRKVELCD